MGWQEVPENQNPFYTKTASLKGMNPDFMGAFAQMAQDYYAQTGKAIKIDDAFRSHEAQADAYRRKPNLAAPPGHSLHEQGAAMDINTEEANELAQRGLLQRYGFYRPMLGQGRSGKNEPWHIQYAGQRRPKASQQPTGGKWVEVPEEEPGIWGTAKEAFKQSVGELAGTYGSLLGQRPGESRQEAYKRIGGATAGALGATGEKPPDTWRGTVGSVLGNLPVPLAELIAMNALLPGGGGVAGSMARGAATFGAQQGLRPEGSTTRGAIEGALFGAIPGGAGRLARGAMGAGIGAGATYFSPGEKTTKDYVVGAAVPGILAGMGRRRGKPGVETETGEAREPDYIIRPGELPPGSKPFQALPGGATPQLALPAPEGTFGPEGRFTMGPGRPETKLRKPPYVTRPQDFYQAVEERPEVMGRVPPERTLSGQIGQLTGVMKPKPKEPVVERTELGKDRWREESSGITYERAKELEQDNWPRIAAGLYHFKKLTPTEQQNVISIKERALAEMQEDLKNIYKDMRKPKTKLPELKGYWGDKVSETKKRIAGLTNQIEELKSKQQPKVPGAGKGPRKPVEERPEVVGRVPPERTLPGQAKTLPTQPEVLPVSPEVLPEPAKVIPAKAEPTPTPVVTPTVTPEIAMKFGEHIGGSRFDRAHGILTVEDLKGMTDREAQALVKKEHIWRKPDYSSMVNEGAQPHVAWLIKKMRDSLPTEPVKPEQRETFINEVGRVRDILSNIKSEEDLQGLFFKVFDESRFDRTKPKYASDRWTDEGNKAARVLGNKFLKAIQVGSWDITQAKRTVLDKGWPFTKGVTTGGERRKLPERPMLENIERTGVDYRIGKNVTSEQFQDAFGFRGGEFGKWLDQTERQDSLNYAHDAFMDLAKILDIPPKAISLEGDLGFAFGARGGGKHAAHYEPGRIVINLTKTRGAGATAHEWAHALDDYFGRQSGKTKLGTFASHGMTPGGVREEMRQAWKSVSDAMTSRYETYEEAVKNAADELNKSIRYTDSWLGGIRLGLSESNKTRLEELKPRILKGDKKAVDELFTFSRPDSQTRKGLLSNFDFLVRRMQRVQDLSEGKEAYNKVKTDFFKEAQKLDYKKSKKYWSEHHEMFARAFETYIESKVEEAGLKSQYLVHDTYTFNKGYETATGYKPYPADMERATINKAFDNLFEVMKTSPSEAKPGATRLYSGGPSASDIRAGVKKVKEWWGEREPLNMGGHTWDGIKYSVGKYFGVTKTPEGTKAKRDVTRMAGRWQTDKLQAEALFGDAESRYAGLDRQGFSRLVTPIQRGGKSPDQAFQKLYDLYHEMGDSLWQKINQYKPLAYLDNYFRQTWMNAEDPAIHENINNYFSGRPFVNYLMMDAQGKPSVDTRPYGGKSLTGGRSYFKQRVIPDVETGMMLGLQPREQNPVRHMLNDLAEKSHFVRGMELWKDYVNRGTVRYFMPGEQPAGWRPIEDHIGRVPTRSGEMQAFAPEEVARTLNNWLSPGFRGEPWYDAYRGIVDPMRKIGVSLSTFHLKMTLMTDMAMRGGQSMSRSLGALLTGDLTTAAKEARNLGKLWSGYSFAKEQLSKHGAGRELLEELMKPGVHPELAEIAADMRDAGLLPISAKSLMPWIENSKGALGEAAMEGMNTLKNLAGAKPLKAVQSAWKGVNRFLDATAAPIMEYAVPRAKASAFASLRKGWLEETGKKFGGVENIPPEVKAQGMYDLARHIDHMMGQINYDALHFNRKLRDLLFFAIKYPGWNLGSANWMMTGARGGFKTLTGQATTTLDRTAWRTTLGLLASVGVTGMVTQYLLTGSFPDDPRDLYTKGIKTGYKDDYGNDEFVRDATYLKDLQSVLHDPVRTFQSKSPDVLRVMGEIYNNSDYFGTDIWTPGASLPQKAGELGKYAFTNLALPYSMRNVAASQSPFAKFGSFGGYSPTPRWLKESPLETELSEASRRRTFKQTRQQFESRQLEKELVKKYRESKDPVALQQGLAEAQREGKLTAKQAQQTFKNAPVPPDIMRFWKSPVDVALTAFERGSPEEKKKYGRLLEEKLNRAVKGRPEWIQENKERIRNVLREIPNQ